MNFLRLTFFRSNDIINRDNKFYRRYMDNMGGGDACSAISLFVTLIPALISGIAAFFICKK